MSNFQTIGNTLPTDTIAYTESRKTLSWWKRLGLGAAAVGAATLGGVVGAAAYEDALTAINLPSTQEADAVFGGMVPEVAVLPEGLSALGAVAFAAAAAVRAQKG